MADKKKVVEHQLFWVMLAVISILILVGLAKYDLTGASVSDQNLDYTIQTIAYEPAGGELYFEGKVDGVKSINVKFAEAVKDTSIKIEELQKVKWFKGDAYSYFKISSADSKKIRSWDLVLKIKETDLQKVWLKKQEVKLYVNGKELATSIDHEESGYVFYQATSLEAGEFVIGKAASVEAVRSVKPVPVVESVPLTEEIKPSQPAPEEAVLEVAPAEATVGKAIEQPASVAVKESFWIKLKNLVQELWN